MFKKIALAGALVMSPLLAGASQLPDYPFIHASGASALYVLPDIGEIDFEVGAANPDPEAARVIVEQRVAAIRALMAEQGVPESDIETRDVRKEMRKGGDPAAAPSYDIKCSLHIKVRKLAAWRAIVQPLLDMPNLGGFSTTFGASEKDKIEMQLMTEAIADARRKAEAMAAALGRKLGPAAAVSSGALKNLGRSMGLVPPDFFGAGGGQREPIKPSDFLNIDILKMAQPVDVIFRIK
ncbi:MAG TPA: SIMPL domain-containing protein [Telluria sp.]|nr:SIMPL domain-containing protein [Telluria sp.]